jgi:hypothetical protein
VTGAIVDVLGCLHVERVLRVESGRSNCSAESASCRMSRLPYLWASGDVRRSLHRRQVSQLFRLYGCIHAHSLRILRAYSWSKTQHLRVSGQHYLVIVVHDASPSPDHRHSLRGCA